MCRRGASSPPASAVEGIFADLLLQTQPSQQDSDPPPHFHGSCLRPTAASCSVL
eukprot:m.208921 g.208921  ORF g.208921 m.208921 type:complete len:54 (+) comp17804_c0_seq1:6897-7058(+)